MERSKTFSKGLMAFSLLFYTLSSLAQSEVELAKTAQNPVANMYSIPFQNNTVSKLLGILRWLLRSRVMVRSFKRRLVRKLNGRIRFGRYY